MGSTFVAFVKLHLDSNVKFHKVTVPVQQTDSIIFSFCFLHQSVLTSENIVLHSGIDAHYADTTDCT